ncbi:MAG TPA: flagellar biosynthesis anti-sigma factor FlgM [Candidatus Glassbacteria bacterium]|nr:flagellar biosynthesis anti-sigma factor FlgM [Candidatus Glassbacteria bacterium]
MKIEHLLQRNKPQDAQKTQQLDSPRESDAKQKSPDGSKPKVDTVTISEQARSLQRTQNELNSLKQKIDGQPDQEKLEQVRAKIASGQYLLDEKVVKGTAEAILASGSLSDLVNSDHPLVRAALAETQSQKANEEKLALVKQRIESGYYNSSDVVNQIADKIMDDLLG